MALDSRFAVGRFDIELISLARSITGVQRALPPRAAGLGSCTRAIGSSMRARLAPARRPVASGSARGRRRVRAIVCDSTNALREGRSPSERDVARTLSGLIRAAKGRSRGHDLRLEHVARTFAPLPTPPAAPGGKAGRRRQGPCTA